VRPKSTRSILGDEIDAVGMPAPGELAANPIGDGTGFNRAVPGGGLEDLLELGLKGTSVSPRARLQSGYDIGLEVANKHLRHSMLSTLALVN